ncbi:MAG TPA: polyprenol monophosphomannose synthase [Anaerolineales bacterium]|nr:polyprenol monophosphomannose synthase [Anaerolineales bacterium]
MQITFVLPTYNEAENLPKLVSALFSLPLPNLKILVADDNSPDGTGKIAEELAAAHPGRMQVLHRPGKEGLGRAYLHGFQVAIENGAEAVGQMDSDFSHPPEKIPEMALSIESHDIVTGSRYVKGGSVDRNWPAWRKGLSAFGNYYARTILGIPVRDVTGGFRLYRRETLQTIPLHRIRSNGYVFQVEMAYLGYLCGFHAHEIPIYFADRKWGESKMSLRIQLEAAIRVWQVKFAYRDLAARR